MLILQGILSLIFLIFAEKSKTHSDASRIRRIPSAISRIWKQTRINTVLSDRG